MCKLEKITYTLFALGGKVIEQKKDKKRKKGSIPYPEKFDQTNLNSIS